MADDFLSQLGNAVASIAPTVASMLGGPLAGQGVQFLESQFGVLPTAGDSLTARAGALLQAVPAQTPEQILALKKEDDALAAKLADANIQLAAIQTADVQSARAMQTATKSWVPGTLMLSVTIGFFGMLGALLFHDIPAANSTIVNIAVGALGSGWTMGLSYFFGSSASSHDKDTSIANLTTPAGR